VAQNTGVFGTMGCFAVETVLLGFHPDCSCTLQVTVEGVFTAALLLSRGRGALPQEEPQCAWADGLVSLTCRMQGGE